jgi:hypothetical protein
MSLRYQVMHAINGRLIWMLLRHLILTLYNQLTKRTVAR